MSLFSGMKLRTRLILAFLMMSLVTAIVGSIGYMNMRDNRINKKSQALFLTEDGFRMNQNQVRNEVRRNLTKVCTLKKRTPHVLRHTFATAMLNHDAGLESVKKLLGHESLSTTEVYTHTTFEQLKREYSNAHPRA